MTPDELAQRHPTLLHVTDADALPSIRRHGLLSTSSLLDLFEINDSGRLANERRRRPRSVKLTHREHGQAVLTDNAPLSEAALTSCLDDGLTAGEWLAILNRRVFLWTATKGSDLFIRARANGGRAKLILEFDTLSLATAYADRIELAAFNTGNTRRKPVRRGLATFTPLKTYSYGDWQRLRGGRDRIKEVTILEGVPDAVAHIKAHRIVAGDWE